MWALAQLLAIGGKQETHFVGAWSIGLHSLAVSGPLAVSVEIPLETFLIQFRFVPESAGVRYDAGHFVRAFHAVSVDCD